MTCSPSSPLPPRSAWHQDWFGNAGAVDVDALENGERLGSCHRTLRGRRRRAATIFTWDLFLVCGDPDDPSTYFAGFPRDQVSPISCPDPLAFDEHGNVLIATDRQPTSIGVDDAVHRHRASPPGAVAPCPARKRTRRYGLGALPRAHDHGRTQRYGAGALMLTAEP